MLTIGAKLRLLDVCECEHVRESLERTHRYVAATASLLLLLFVSSNLCASQRHAGKDREKEQSIQFTPLSGNQPRTPTIPPKKYFYGLVRRLSDFLSALPPTFECTPSHSHSVESVGGGSLLLPWIRTSRAARGNKCVLTSTLLSSR